MKKVTVVVKTANDQSFQPRIEPQYWKPAVELSTVKVHFCFLSKRVVKTDSIHARHRNVSCVSELYFSVMNIQVHLGRGIIIQLKISVGVAGVFLLLLICRLHHMNHGVQLGDLVMCLKTNKSVKSCFIIKVTGRTPNFNPYIYPV